MSGDREGRRAGHWAVAIVRASRRLSPAAKLVYGLVAELDRGDRGAFMSQRGLAEQLGMNEKHVGALRLELLASGLLDRERRDSHRRRRGQALESWFALLPRGVPASPPEGLSTDARRAWVREAAARLDSVIAAATPITGNSGAPATTSPDPLAEITGNTGVSRPTSPDSLPPITGNSGEVARGTPESARQSVTLKAVGQECDTPAADAAEHDSGASRPQEGVRQGAGARPVPAGWGDQWRSALKGKGGAA